MKKIHIYLWALLLGSMTTVYAQTPEDIDKNKSFLPNSTPPAPEAFAMTKYGDVPVDEFNGRVNLDVPIFQYKAGMLSVPVSLNYNGAGVKVNDIPTQVGINWSLNAGGLISREIKGQPDEVLEKLTLSLSQIVALNQQDCTEEAEDLRAIIDNNNLDKENDIFNFNFLGYSGSFFLNDTFDPVLTKNDQELRIEIFGSEPNKSKRLREGKTFMITTPDGVKFYFGGALASEESAMVIRSNGTPDLNSIGGITSFYLYKIEHPVNGIILLDYETTDPYHANVNMNYFTTKKMITAYDEMQSNNPNMNCYGVPTSIVSYSYGTSQTQHYIINQKMVKKIYSPDTTDYILFTRDVYTTAVNYKKVLKTVEFFKGNNIFQKANFEYIGLSPTPNAHRFFLKKVDFNSHISNMDAKREAYVFEYNNPMDLPSINSYSKDVLGFYNGISNSTLYPRFPEENQNGAPNRTSNFAYASKGVLQKVIYPTKGYTEFTYEGQPYVEPKYQNFGINTYINSTGSLDGEGVYVNGMYQKLHDELPGVSIDEDGNQTVAFYEPVGITQRVNILLSASTTLTLSQDAYGNPRYPNKMAKAKVRIIEKLNGNVISTVENQNGQLQTISFPYEFKAGHTYKIELDLTPPLLGEDYSASGNVSFNLQTGYHAPTSYGVRLKSIKNYDGLISTPSVKRFFYKPYHKLDDIFVDAFQFSNVAKVGGYLGGCSQTFAFIPVKTNTLNSAYDFLDNTLLGNFRDYSCVTVGYGTDEEPFKNGGLEKTFALEAPIQSYRIMPRSNNDYMSLGDYGLTFIDQFIYSNSNPMNGQVILEKTFANKNGIKKVKETKYDYSNLVAYQKYNLAGNKLVTDNSVLCQEYLENHGRTLSNYWINCYYTNSFAFKKTVEKVTDYIDPVPATLIAHVPSEEEDPNAFPTQDQLEASYKKVITTQSYEYGTLRGMPTKITMTNSNGELQINENVYVNQYGTLTGLNTEQTNAYAALLAQNNVASPIETKQSDNLGVLNKKRTTYKVLSGNKVVPETIQTAKENFDLEERAVFEQYDSKGNPTIMSLTGGVKIKYLYNTQNQVIAKIENFTGTLDANTNSIGDITAFRNQFPNAMVSVFEYDPITNLLVRMYDPNGKKMTYEYDALHRLKLIKDNDNNVIKEFDQNFKN